MNTFAKFCCMFTAPEQRATDLFENSKISYAFHFWT